MMDDTAFVVGGRKILLDDEENHLKRVLYYRDIRNMTLAAELLNLMADEVSDKKKILNILQGKNPLGHTQVARLIRAFRESDSEDIREYYLKNFQGRADEILAL